MINVRFPSHGSYGLMCIALFCFASCLQDLSPLHAPCTTDADCWNQLKCTQGACGGPKRSESESAVEKMSNEPKEGTDASEPKAEKVTEQRQEQQPEPLPDLPPGVGKKLYEACAWYDWAPEKDKCNPGLYCHRTHGTKAFCLRDCSQNQALCTSDPNQRSECRIVGWTKSNRPARACVKSAALQAPCDPSKGLFCKNEGPTPSKCIEFTCRAVKQARLGEACDPYATTPIVCAVQDRLMCGANKTCIKARPSYEWDFCNDNACPIGTKCIRLNTDTKLCGRSCKNDIDCAKSDVASKCYSGFCYQFGCTADYDCKYKTAPLSCHSNATFKTTFCQPRSVSGPKTFGGVCSTSGNPLHSCQPHLRCLRPYADKQVGACSVHCREHADCQKYNPKYKCYLVAGGGAYKLCGLPCSNPQDCSADHTCFNGTCWPKRETKP